MNEAGALPQKPKTLGHWRPNWARRLFRKMGKRHDFSSFEGCAWAVRSLDGQPPWLERKNTNGDVLRFNTPATPQEPGTISYYKRQA